MFAFIDEALKLMPYVPLFVVLLSWGAYYSLRTRH